MGDHPLTSYFKQLKSIIAVKTVKNVWPPKKCFKSKSRHFGAEKLEMPKIEIFCLI